MKRLIAPTRKQALEQVRRDPKTRGVCHQCGCTEYNACTGEGFFGDETCSWFNKEKTLCSKFACIQKARGGHS